MRASFLENLSGEKLYAKQHTALLLERKLCSSVWPFNSYNKVNMTIWKQNAADSYLGRIQQDLQAEEEQMWSYSQKIPYQSTKVTALPLPASVRAAPKNVFFIIL
ncbi:hypothetical protein AMECASPLE_001773 [Ameca splendens]|uniref:Uncharacterized protein n=1 Tax=Ameca splendens TaxID=208324 RepID=A0ABV0XA07_9TELE